MGTTRELTPAEKARRTRLINEAVELDQQRKQADARIKEIQAELWPEAEAEIEESGGKSVVFQGTRGSCEIGRTTSTSIADVDGLRTTLGARFEELVEKKEAFSLSSSLKKIIEDPQPQERGLSDAVRRFLSFRDSSRFVFRPAA